jgi:hypothetical protein
MALLGWLWLATPFTLIGVISHDPRLLGLVSKHHKRCRRVGWAGAATMLLGVMLVPGPIGASMFVIGTPVTGLIVWARGDDGDDGGDDPPDVPPIDWDQFERSFRAYARRRRPRRPRAPVGR